MTPLSRLQKALTAKPTEAILVSSEINQRYFSDFDYSDGCQLITHERAFLFTDPRYGEAAHAAVKDFEIVVVERKPNFSMEDAVAEIARAQRVSRVLVEEHDLCMHDYREWEKKLPCPLAVGASDLISPLRRVKSPEELARIARAQEIADAAFAHILSFLSPNVTEREVALELEFFMRRHGAEATAFDTIAVSGASSSLPHGKPQAVKLRRGFLTMDFGARFNGYCSDMTRTVVIGRADEEMKKVYHTVLSAQRAALDFLAEGVLCRDVDAAARKVISDAGYGAYFTHSLGHGIGMLVHESPSFSRLAKADSRLERGNVMSVEPGIYLEGKFGVRIEDMIAVEHDGSIRNFTKSPKELIEI